MQTKQIYYEDQYKQNQTAKVISIEVNVSLATIILDKTIFYPAGGGQPSDQGIIKAKDGELKVQEVIVKNGEIQHTGKLIGIIKSGETVDCQIDWNRRYKNMRVHSAGHVIHDAVMHLYPHLKAVEAEHGKKPYIKYEGRLEPIAANILLEKANEIVSKDVEIKTSFVSLEELKKRAPWIPLNLPKNKPLRIMQIGNYSPIPDGGTQIKNTGEIKNITSIEIHNDRNTSLIYYKIQDLDFKTMPEHKNTIDYSLSVNDVINVKNQSIAQISQANSPEELDTLKVELLGKNGKVTQLIKSIKRVDPEKRQQFGELANETKAVVEQMLSAQKSQYTKEQTAWFDPTIPGKFIKTGHLHPTSIVIKEMFDIFTQMGFSITEGPEIESDHYNFELLNLPKDHPARSLQDVLYLNEPEVLLRSHTSSVETRSIKNLKAPFRVVVAGKCYRYENLNASNNAMFYQFQGFALQKGLSLADLKGTLLRFVENYFGNKRKVRFRCKYYPEVEPGVGLDLNCEFCNGQGCAVCKGRGWIEMLGAGMIHPNILKNFGYKTSEISGFAFGMGLDRIVMDRFKIRDIRSLYNGDIKYT